MCSRLYAQPSTHCTCATHLRAHTGWMDGWMDPSILQAPQQGLSNFVRTRNGPPRGLANAWMLGSRQGSLASIGSSSSSAAACCVSRSIRVKTRVSLPSGPSIHPSFKVPGATQRCLGGFIFCVVPDIWFQFGLSPGRLVRFHGVLP